MCLSCLQEDDEEEEEEESFEEKEEEGSHFFSREGMSGEERTCGGEGGGGTDEALVAQSWSRALLCSQQMSREALNLLVLDYLVVQGHQQAVAAFTRETTHTTQEDRGDGQLQCQQQQHAGQQQQQQISAREEARKHLLSGDVLSCMRLLDQLDPRILRAPSSSSSPFSCSPSSPSSCGHAASDSLSADSADSEGLLLFDLMSLHFAELLLGGRAATAGGGGVSASSSSSSTAAAILFAQESLLPLALKEPALLHKVEQMMSLVAFASADNIDFILSPQAPALLPPHLCLLGDALDLCRRRKQLAARVNRAVLRSCGLSCEPRLTSVLRKMTHLQQKHQQKHPRSTSTGHGQSPLPLHFPVLSNVNSDR